MKGTLMRLCGGFLLLLVFVTDLRAADVSNIKSDQEIIFFPTIGYRAANGKGWEIEIHGCVFEPEKRRAALALMRQAFDIRDVELTAAEQGTFAIRARLFMVDHERGKSIVVRIAGKDFKLRKSTPDGHFSDTLRVSDEELKGLDLNPLVFQAKLDPSDARVFSGTVNLLGKTGIIVISDIDDTIKITHVTNRSATLRSTFLEPFKPVPGMADLYQQWSTNSGAQIIYLSASPWQLFAPMSDFVRSNNFPAGGFYLKSFRWKDRTFFDLFMDPEKYKPGLIEPLLRRFPERRFVFVGDSGESDPEIYGQVARRFPKQVIFIFIRDVTGHRVERYEKAFRDVPSHQWKVFQDADELSRYAF